MSVPDLVRQDRPAWMLHRGSVMASGLLLSPALLSPAELRRRVLAHWRPGVVVVRLVPDDERAQALVALLLPEPERLRCDQSDGAPLVAHGPHFEALPLVDGQRRALRCGEPAVVCAQGGVVRCLPLSRARAEPVEQWLDLDAVAVLQCTPLGSEAPMPKRAASRGPATARQALGAAVPDADERQVTLSALLRDLHARADRGGVEPNGGAGDSVGTWLAGLIDGVRQLLRSRADAGGAGGGEALKKGRSSQALHARRWRGGLLDRVARALARLRDRAMFASRLSRLLGARQARYLAEMVDMFERGDIAEALRRAIPLSKGDTGPQGPGSHDWSLPQRRAELHLEFVPRGGAITSYLFGPQVYEHLRKTYRRTFDRLVAQGKIGQAAFVLAELLGEDVEAVAFLERHGLLKEAARLAEARRVDPAIIVRQHIVAGDIGRAVMVARRTRSFAAAIRLLQDRDPEQAMALRVLWSRLLEQGGDLVGAVATVWPVEPARPAALALVDRGLAEPGLDNAELMAWAAADEARWPSLRPRLFALLEEQSEEAALARAALAARLLDPEGPAKRGRQLPASMTALARGLARATLADDHAHPNLVSSAQRELLALAADPALRADRPPASRASAPQRLRSLTQPVALTQGTARAGKLPVLDLAPLPTGGVLVAVGEAGAMHYDARGRLRHHFDQPVHHLVLADHGRRAIGLAPRGGSWRLCRLELDRRRAGHWTDAAIELFAPTHDGNMWFVTQGPSLLAIDVLGGELRSMWRLPDVQGKATSLARTATTLDVLVANNGDWTQLHFDTGALQLRSRREVGRSGAARQGPAVVDARAVGYGWSLVHGFAGPDEEGDEARPAGWLEGPGRSRIDIPFSCLAQQGALHPLWTDVDPQVEKGAERWVVRAEPGERGVELELLDPRRWSVQLRLSLMGAFDVKLRRTGRMLAVGDDLGRVMVVDLHAGKVALRLAT